MAHMSIEEYESMKTFVRYYEAHQEEVESVYRAIAKINVNIQHVMMEEMKQLKEDAEKVLAEKKVEVI